MRTKLLNPAPTTIVRNDYWGYAQHTARLNALAGMFPVAAIVLNEYPMDELEGNDDTGVRDEDNDPYNGVTPVEGTPVIPGIAPVAGSDDPNSPWIREASGNVNETVEVRFQFGEFVRLQIGNNGGAGYRNWYRVSDFFDWQTVIRYRRAPAGMVDDGTTVEFNNAGW